jgi:hypothetical protein
VTGEERFEKYMESLSEEERVGFWNQYDERLRIREQGPSNTPRSILAAAHLGGQQPTGLGREQFERGEREGALSVPVAGVAAAGGAAALAHPWLTAGSVAAAEGGYLGAKALGAGDKTAAGVGIVAGMTPGALAAKALRMGVGAVTGAASTKVLGGSAKEGAKFGALRAAGQGGSGALWKHGKKRKIIDWALKYLDKASAEIKKGGDEALEEILGPPPGMTTTKMPPKATIPTTSGAPSGRVTTTAAPTSAPAPKPASPGAVRSAAHVAERKVLVAFAKPLAKSHKFGEKVWLELNAAGEPVRVMTPGQASRVAESAKTWIKKLWRD